MTSLSFVLANSYTTFAAATASALMLYINGPTILSDITSKEVPCTARRASVFFNTCRYTPFLRALARKEVISATGMPRYSATTMVWACATCALTSATTACFSCRLRAKVFLHPHIGHRYDVRVNDRVLKTGSEPQSFLLAGTPSAWADVTSSIKPPANYAFGAYGL